MRDAFRFAGVAFVSTLAVASFTRAENGSQSASRVVIRGTGRDVVLERVPATAPAPAGAERGALAEAGRLAAGGAADADLVGYLRAHRGEIPSILDASQIGRLRKAGAGDPVVDYLASVSALDVGPTGEGGAPAPPAEALSAEGYGYGEGYYPGAYYGGGYYGGGYASNGWGGRFGHERFSKHTFGPRFGLHPTRPIARPGLPKVPHSRGAMGHGGAPRRGRM